MKIALHLISFAASKTQKSSSISKAPKSSSTSDSGEETDRDESETSHSSERRPSARTIMAMRRPSMIAASLKSQHYGSFYLRMGAVGNYTST